VAVFFHNDTDRRLLIATPANNAGSEGKAALLFEALRMCGECGLSNPKVALLDFTEQYESFMKVPSIREARELVERYGESYRSDGSAKACAVVEGPMAFDIAVSETAARIKKYSSRVAGKTDMFFMPDYTSGVLLTELYKRWDTLRFPWKAADISYGGAVPILIPSRSDSYEHKLRSITAAAFISMY
jgi:phosphotransacetylase